MPQTPLSRSLEVFAAIALLSAACSDEAALTESTPERPSTSTGSMESEIAPTPEHTDRQEPAQPEPPSEPPPSPSPFELALGEHNVDILRNPTLVEAGRMRVIGALQAHNARLSSDTRILGYPIQGALQRVAPADASRIADLILDDASYTDLVRRCRNDYLVGIRFTKDNERVEFALGMPCEQGFFAFRDAAGAIQGDGKVMLSPQAAEVIRLCGSP
jgi:hypothetical protein